MGRTHTRMDALNRPVWTVVGYALVPMIPLDVRPKTGIPENACILWEVEKWADRSLDVVPDIDPYLLKPVAGSLYAVIAEWDLTPLERAILHKRVTKTYA